MVDPEFMQFADEINFFNQVLQGKWFRERLSDSRRWPKAQSHKSTKQQRIRKRIRKRKNKIAANSRAKNR